MGTNDVRLMMLPVHQQTSGISRIEGEGCPTRLMFLLFREDPDLPSKNRSDPAQEESFQRRGLGGSR